MRLLLIVALAAGLAGAEPAEPHAAEHQALRALMAEAVAALNAGDADALGRCLALPCDITFADQRHLGSAAEIADYAARLKKERGIERVAFAPQVDGPARFVGSDVAIATGTSADSFTGSDGETTTIPSRWSAVCQRTEAGWRIAALHTGVDPLRNPILDRVTATATRLLSWAAFAGVIAGGIIGWLLGRRGRPVSRA